MNHSNLAGPVALAHPKRSLLAGLRLQKESRRRRCLSMVRVGFSVLQAVLKGRAIRSFPIIPEISRTFQIHIHEVAPFSGASEAIP
jgi:hypothetical protein